MNDTLGDGSTLGSATSFSVVGTLGSAATGRGATGIGAVGGEGGEQSSVDCWKMSANWNRAWRLLSLSGASGDAGLGLVRAAMRSRAAAEASSVVDARGMET